MERVRDRRRLASLECGDCGRGVSERDDHVAPHRKGTMFNSQSWFRAGSWAVLITLGLLGSSTVFGQRDDYKVAPARDESLDIPPGAKPGAAAKIKAEIRERRKAVRESLSEADL